MSASKSKVLSTTKASLAFNDEIMDESPELDCFAECNDHAPSRRKSSLSRRRSSMGLGSSKVPILSEAEQIRIADMYKTVIQMASENKINEKNSWSFDLIDHMGNLIGDETKGVNFQKASCTLDASVKIYSNRVDDTYASSHRILESLSRGNGPSDENEDGEGTKKAKVGSKASSSRLNITETIEKNPEALNAVKLENDYAFDPMFHKLSKAFDEGGAKGMLLYNMRLSTNNCSLSFPVKGAENRDSLKNHIGYSKINISDLVQRSGITTDTLKPLTICSKLNEFRKTLNIPESKVGVAKPDEFVTLQIPEAVIQTVIPENNFVGNNSPQVFAENDYFDNDNMMNDHFDLDDVMMGDFDDQYVQLDEQIVPVQNPLPQSPGDAEPTKLKWSSIVGTSNGMDQDVKTLVSTLQQLKMDGNNEYGYFDIDELHSSGNAWAGSQHWKYATRSAKAKVETQTEDNNDEAPQAISQPEKKKKAKKETSLLTFTMELMDDTKLGISSTAKKADSTLQTKASIEKSIKFANNLLLPIDEKLQVRDICRLFTLPNVVVAPKNMNSLLNKTSCNGNSKKSQYKIQNLLESMNGEDKIWSHALNGFVTSTVVVNSVASENMDVSMIGAPMDNYDMDNDFGDLVENSYPEENDNVENQRPVVNLEGLNINQDGLLKAGRVVEKIDINYSKVSKRVNVHKLKKDIWSNIQDKVLPNEFNKPSKQVIPQNESLSFKNIIDELDDENQQKGVTLPYYFICLLHLANENDLKIEGLENMADLKISVDQVA